MNPPVDPVEQFFSMFARANTAVWPMQVVWYAAALAAIGLAITPARNASRLIAGLLAVYYAWLGIVFFGIFYSPINDHALAAGAMFVLGGALWLIAGVVRPRLQFQPHWDLPGVVGGVIMLYALAIYPVIGTVTGHDFPAAPVFGVAPCPSVIFTAGLLLWSRPRLPAYVIVVPLFWLLAQSPADAIAFTLFGDLARPVVGIVATGLLIWRDYRGVGERLFGGAMLLVAALCLGQDSLLMALAFAFLGVTFLRWLLQQPGLAPARWTLTSQRR